MNTKRSILFARLVLGLALIVALASISVRPSLALFTPFDGQAATLVLGQPNFTSAIQVITQTGMAGLPWDVTVDPITAKVFVADRNVHRILRFASAADLTNGAPAEAVLGQPNFTSSANTTTQNGMYYPSGLFVDAAGRLWVADYGNHRILRFDNASTRVNGANADGVLGQPDFTSGTSNVTQSKMFRPTDVFVDSDGRLWVTDQENCRILRFDNAATKANGASADGVLGQINFTSRVCTTSQNGMYYPQGLFIDSNDRLWVADLWNNRVIRFDNPALKADGANADGVLGQANFTSGSQATTQ
ncbi:MAG TPA: NHL repeat-containing protein, partial [Anaerolineales bacterium]|nr:NHL repeat-containing protein [Anaerolineales bacterium]